ncbi:MAG TPA: YhfC family glutamic-type intramembrane protease [Rhizomicrobium sp.]|nr:YhfC family glutamic-type intramembrane protease [Rhizomicrobium sp.]
MVSQAALAGLALSFLVSLIAPFAVYFVLRRRMTLSWRNIAVGAGMFVLFALVLEQALHYFVLKANPATSAWMKTHVWAFAAYGALAAGVFEETGRYVGMRFLVRPTGNPGTATAYGLGHGGLETLLIGALAQLSAIAMALALNVGMLDAMLGTKLPPAAIAMVHNQLVHLTFPIAALGSLERLIALALQIALSVLVWRAVELRKAWLYLAAIVFHAGADTGAALLQAHFVTSVIVVEGWAFAVLIALVLFLRLTPRPAPV